MNTAIAIAKVHPTVSSWCCSWQKRLFDLLCGIALLIISSPLMVLAAVLVWLTSSGPILFRQQRMGCGGSEFTALKFRTMVHSKMQTGPGVTRAGDPRITPVGRLLRKSKLDELPQLFNVIRGDMSLVGPRPDLPEYLAKLPPHLSDLLLLRPGVTGWATIKYRHEEQVLASVPPEHLNDYYVHVLLPEKARLDMEYGKCATFWTDVVVLVRTGLAILAPDRIGAQIRHLLQWAWAILLARTGCLYWAKRQLCNSGAIVTLMFHRVLNDTAHARTHSPSGMAVRSRTFAELVAYVAHECEAVDLREAAPGEPCKKIMVAFTFDDGWKDNYTVAFPITRDCGIPLTIFLCPGVVGRIAPFWPERAIALLRALRFGADDAEITTALDELKKRTPEERDRYLTQLADQASKLALAIEVSSADATLSWAEIMEMDEAGVCFGSHTHTHQILTMIPADAARQEIRSSKAAMERALQMPCNTFSYPNGNWSPELAQLLKEEGFELAVTTERGAWTARSERLAIPRLNVYEDNVVGPTGQFSPAMFEYTTFWKAWRALKAQAAARPRTETIG